MVRRPTQPTPTVAAGTSGSAGGLSVTIEHQDPYPVQFRTTTVDRLRALKDGKRNVLSEVAWAALGGAIGSGPTGIPMIGKFFGSAPVSLTQAEFLQVVFTILGSGVFITCQLIVMTRGRNAEDIFESIVNPGGKK